MKKSPAHSGGKQVGYPEENNNYGEPNTQTRMSSCGVRKERETGGSEVPPLCYLGLVRGCDNWNDSTQPAALPFYLLVSANLDIQFSQRAWKVIHLGQRLDGWAPMDE